MRIPDKFFHFIYVGVDMVQNEYWASYRDLIINEGPKLYVILQAEILVTDCIISDYSDSNVSDTKSTSKIVQ